jgi:hypothetical protein
MNQKFRFLVAVAVCSLLTANHHARAQGTVFTYQGQLNAAGGPANGSYDLQFTLYATNTNGVPIAGPVTNLATAVSNGVFTTAINFGQGVFTGGSNWLDIAVRTNGTVTFTELPPRQPITPTPYSIYAGNAGSVAATDITGTIPLPELPNVLVTNNATSVTLSGNLFGNFGGTFFGNGAGLTGLSPSNLNAGTATINITGNAATATTASNVTGNISTAQLIGTVGSNQIVPASIGNTQLGLCQISGFVTCNNSDPTHTFVYIRGTSALSYVGNSTSNGYPYQLTLLQPGTYTVVSRTSAGYEVSAPVTVSAGQAVTNINFSGANLLADVNNCGSCSNVCNLPNAAQTCTNGACQVALCNAGFAHCSGPVSNGCEVNVTTNLNNCGACGVVCNLPNATSSCSNSACQVVSCSPGFGNCNGIASDGCEVNLNTNVNNCGNCGLVCNPPNSTPLCNNGACQILSCVPGFANCNGSIADGCEVNTNSTLNNCGGCGIICSFTNATSFCVTGTCQFGSCNPGYAHCAGPTSNGCETHTATDANNCGACGTVCSYANGTPGCNNSICYLASCNSGYNICTISGTSYCANFTNDPNNCGSCGHVCASGHSCVASACN